MGSRETQLLPGCEVRCPGCTHRSLTKEQSEAQKLNWVRSQFKETSSSFRIAPVQSVSETQRYRYRHKVTLHSEWKNESWHFGLRVRKKDGGPKDFEIIPIHNCPIQSEKISFLLGQLSAALPDPSVFPLAFLMISGSILTFVVKSKSLPTLPRLNWAQLGLQAVWINMNYSAGDRVLANRGWNQIWGCDEGLAKENSLWHGPESFLQLIPSLHASALEESKTFLSPQSGDLVLDLCSGIGSSLRLWQQSQAHFLGIELSSEAVKCAARNLDRPSSENKACFRGLISLPKGEILRGKISHRVPQIQDWLSQYKSIRNKFLVYANPPRTGLEPEVTKWLAQTGRPDRIAYLSCNAKTLAQDTEIFTQSGYLLDRIVPYDFFPHTRHVETLALLQRR